MTTYQLRLVLRALCDLHTKKQLLDGSEVRADLVDRLGLPEEFVQLLIQEALAIKCVGGEIPRGWELMQ